MSPAIRIGWHSVRANYLYRNLRALSQSSGQVEKEVHNIFIKALTQKMEPQKLQKLAHKKMEPQKLEKLAHKDTAYPPKVENVVYDKKIRKLIEQYLQVLVCSADNVGSNQLQSIRQHLRPDSVVLMGKNTMMKRSISIYSEKTGNKICQKMIPLLAGNVGLIFTKGNLIEMVAPPGNRGVELILMGDKVGSSEAALLAKLGIHSFSYGLIVKAIYGNGLVFDPEFLDFIKDDLNENFSSGFSLWQPFLWLSTILQ